MWDILGAKASCGDRVDRRQWLRIGGLSPLGLSLAGLLSAQARGGERSARAPAKRCVVLMMSGGPAHQDTFDMKPEAPSEYRSAFLPIATRAPGIEICEHFPHLAQHTDKIAFVRSVTHTDNNHSTAAHWMTTGHQHRVSQENFVASRRDWPHMGSVVAKLNPQRSPLPKYVILPERSHNDNGAITPGQDGGFLGGVYDPLWIEAHPDAADFEVPSLRLQNDLSPVRLRARASLLQTMDEARRQFDWARSVHGADTYYQQAFDLLDSTQAHQAFNLSAEDDTTRQQYGRWAFGQSLLLARRLLEAGVKLVTVNWPRHASERIFKHWDTHSNGFQVLKDQLIPFADRPVATFLHDLEQRGLLAETLVVWTSEFGRSPKGQHDGHWGACNTVWLAGGGIRGGTIYGASDRYAAYPADQPVKPADLTATVFHQLGLDPRTTLSDGQGRPFPISAGQPLAAIC